MPVDVDEAGHGGHGWPCPKLGLVGAGAACGSVDPYRELESLLRPFAAGP